MIPDADSIISSFCNAYLSYLKTQNHQKSLTDCNLHVPVVAIQRKELHLRREVQVLLKKVNLDLNDLICIDEVKSLPLPPSEYSNIKFTLLDHNLMSTAVSGTFLSPSQPQLVVHEILDHHKDMGAYPEVTDERRNIAFSGESAMVGSACTLVFEAFHTMNNTDNVEKAALVNGPQLSSGSLNIDVEVAVLLAGVIALDTLNMSPQAAKGTPRDARALATLQTIISPLVPDLNVLFDELSNAKTDPSFWFELNAHDCLLLDYKLFSVQNKSINKLFSIGMSSVSLSAEFMLQKSDLIEACKQYLFSVENKGETVCDVLIIMCTTMVPTFSRDLIVITKSEARLHDLISFLTGGNYCTTAVPLSVDLKLSPLVMPASSVSVDSKKNVADVKANFKLCGMYQAVYHQGNVKASRKQVAPLVSEYFETTEELLE